MNNDLISRSELKKSLKSNCDVCNDKNTNWCEHCCPLNDFEDLIDNAPTVKTYCYFCGQTEHGRIEEIPQGELADEVWELYEKHQSHLATHVIEFGDELKELLGKYQKGGAE